MSSTKIPLVLMFTAFLVGIVAIFLARAELPEQVASHYDSSGTPDGWMDRDTFLGLYAGLLVLMAGLFGGLAAFLPRLPNAMINVPHKDYWLAPERRDESLRGMTSMLVWIGVATLLFLVALFRMTWTANLSESGELGDGFWILLAGYLGITLGVAIGGMMRYRKPPPTATTP